MTLGITGDVNWMLRISISQQYAKGFFGGIMEPLRATFSYSALRQLLACESLLRLMCEWSRRSAQWLALALCETLEAGGWSFAPRCLFLMWLKTGLFRGLCHLWMELLDALAVGRLSYTAKPWEWRKRMAHFVQTTANGTRCIHHEIVPLGRLVM